MTMMQKLNRNWLFILKLTWETLQILTGALESLKNLFNWFLVTKVYIVWATKVQRSYLSWHWRDMQILKKTWIVVWKQTWEFGKFSPEHLKVSKLGHWWNSFVQYRKGKTIKFQEELCAMTMKNNAKFEEKCHFKTDMRNLTNFDSGTWKP